MATDHASRPGRPTLTEALRLLTEWAASSRLPSGWTKSRLRDLLARLTKECDRAEDEALIIGVSMSSHIAETISGDGEATAYTVALALREMASRYTKIGRGCKNGD